MPVTTTDETKSYWRSLEELASTPEFTEFLHREFPTAASEYPEEMSRRRWLQLMGASLAMVGVSGCRWQKETVAPFAARPENRIPGVPQRFATSLETGGYSRPLIVTTYDGRPIKVEGHIQHPASLGGTDAFSQASLLHLYDPDRSKTLVEVVDGVRYTRTWDDFSQFVKGLFNAAASSRIRIVSERSSSLTRARLTKRFLEICPNTKWYEHEAISRSNERLGTKVAFGEELRPVYDLAQADIVLALDSDLFDFHPQSVSLIRAWSERRVPEAGPMNRVYAVESQFSTLGTVADHRLQVRSSEIGLALSTIEAIVAAGSDAKSEHKSKDKAEGFMQALCADLISHRGRSVVIAGPTQPASVHAAVYRLNAMLGNIGQTVSFVRETPTVAVQTEDPLADLAKEIERGDVDTLVVLGGNPAYESVALRKALPKLKNCVRLGDYADETSQLASWHLPRAHQFETWGEGRSYDGTLTLRQPLINPIFGSRSDEEVLAMLCGDERVSSEEITRDTFSRMIDSDDFEFSWRKLVHDGFLAEDKLIAVNPTIVQAPMETTAVPLASPSELEVVFTPSHSTFDGRFANNGWLQETPAPLTKITWQNVAILAPSTARDKNVETGEIIRVTIGDTSIELPVYVLPGQAPGSIGLALGYGRTAAGHVGGDPSLGIPAVGTNVSPLRSKGTSTFETGVQIAKTDRRAKLAMTQDHHAIDKVGLAEIAGRIGQLVREGTEKQYAADPSFAQHVVHHPPLESLWTERSPEGHAWGMSIDLSRCIGCNACMVACQSENNVPIVGPEQVAKGREMHWIRVDRYFAGEVDDPQVVTQPVTCHHCENAPCEQVCPVAATTHSPEGLNDMAYNRCVGTRYCANNCPYKVRRFNFLDFTSHLDRANEELARLIINPEVTVRSRGVMEKCTFCVQRIQTVKIDSKNGQRPIVDGEIQTACQQACPAKAISFGDLLDQKSAVAVAHENPRSYGMLAELNVKPRTKYLARIRNPHPDLAPELPASHSAGHEHSN